jgi:hypothetical protein
MKAAFRKSVMHRLLVMMAGLACGRSLLGQVAVVTEFHRIDPFGETVREDRQETYREVLSPAVARNATSSFRVVVELPAGKFYYLYVGLNPEDAVKVKVYKEVFARQPDGRWIPDELKEIELPYLGSVGSQGIPGQKVDTYWLDMFVPKNAAVRRIKVDPQVHFEDHWISYPMEVRVVAAQVEGDLPGAGESAPIHLPVDASAQMVWRAKLCKRFEKKSVSGPLTSRQLIERNARQDAALRGLWTVRDVTSVLGAKDAGAWCEAYVPSPAGPENYLRLRDRILRAAE